MIRATAVGAALALTAQGCAATFSESLLTRPSSARVADDELRHVTVTGSAAARRYACLPCRMLPCR